MTIRLREEMQEGNDPRTAADLAVEHAGPTVVSAGIILAGTFASLGLTGISLLVQLGATIAIGVVIVSFVMATVLVPSLSALIGKRVWWPGHEAGAAAPVAAGDHPTPGRVPAASPCSKASASQLPTTRPTGRGHTLPAPLHRLSAARYRANLLGYRAASEEKDQQLRLERRLLMLVRNNLGQPRKHFVRHRERLQE